MRLKSEYEAFPAPPPPLSTVAVLDAPKDALIISMPSLKDLFLDSPLMPSNIKMMPEDGVEPAAKAVAGSKAVKTAIASSKMNSCQLHSFEHNISSLN